MLLRYTKETEERARVYCRVYIYDASTSRNNTIEVSELPDEPQVQDGYANALYCNPVTEQVWYEAYELPPAPPAEPTIADLIAKNLELEQQLVDTQVALCEIYETLATKAEV